MAQRDLRPMALLWLGLMFTAGVIYKFASPGLSSTKAKRVSSGKELPSSKEEPKMDVEPMPSTTLPQIAVERQRLLQLLEWPGPPAGATPFAFSTSPNKSHYQLLQAQQNYTVGDTLLVQLQARDHGGQPKHYGGDFFQAKVHSPELKASAPGRVQDHRNGTYTLAFPLHWAGAVQVSVRLIHSSEAVALLQHVRRTWPSTVAFLGYFETPDQPGTEERTECNVHPPPGPACQYTDTSTGERWFCTKPKRHPCSALVHHSSGIYKNVLPANTSVFLSRAVTNQNIPGSLPLLQVLPGPQLAVATSSPRPCHPGLPAASLPGFYYQDVWVSLGCSSRTFPTPDRAKQCLRGKVVHMIGDSTLRQWWEFLVGFIPSLKSVDLHVQYKSGPLLAVDPAQGLVLNWRAHGLPLRTEKTKVADLHYTANELDALGGGPHLVVVLTLWAHFTTFPVEFYIRRLHQVREAVGRLLARSPRTTVVLKTANTSYKSVYGSDWLCMQLDTVLRAMFAGLKVVLVDAWAMTSCHYLPENIHPAQVIVQNEVNVFLSYICPKN